jgi:hypothetical protein
MPVGEIGETQIHSRVIAGGQGTGAEAEIHQLEQPVLPVVADFVPRVGHPPRQIPLSAGEAHNGCRRGASQFGFREQILHQLQIVHPFAPGFIAYA